VRTRGLPNAHEGENSRTEGEFRCRTRLRRPFSIARYWSARKIHPSERPTEVPLDETGVEFDEDKIES